MKKRNFLIRLIVNLVMGLIGAREVDENGFVIGECADCDTDGRF